MGGIEYVQLMASLPALGPILAAKRAPINRIRLLARLQMLRREHLAEIEAAANLLAWPDQAMLTSDADFVSKARKVIETLKSETLRQLVHHQLEQRTVLAALRRRHAGQAAPAASEIWGYGRYVDRIRANWREPGFGLAPSLKWVLPVKERLDKSDAPGLERILLEAAWRHADGLVGRIISILRRSHSMSCAGICSIAGPVRRRGGSGAFRRTHRRCIERHPGDRETRR